MDKGEQMKNASYANRGMALEELISRANALYYRDGVAVIQKVPTAFIPIRDKSGKIVSCKVEQKSCVDYIGWYLGDPIAIEAKETKSDRIDLNRVQPHQADFLSKWSENPFGGMAYVLVSFGLQDFYMIPWNLWSVAIDSHKLGIKGLGARLPSGEWWYASGKATINKLELPDELSVELGGRYLLNYLTAAKRP